MSPSARADEELTKMLTPMKMSALRQQAIDSGIKHEQLLQADNAEDPKAEIISLLVSQQQQHGARPEAPHQQHVPGVEQQPVGAGPEEQQAEHGAWHQPQVVGTDGAAEEEAEVARVDSHPSARAVLPRAGARLTGCESASAHSSDRPPARPTAPCRPPAPHSRAAWHRSR